jgi:hypothetical protein
MELRVEVDQLASPISGLHAMRCFLIASMRSGVNHHLTASCSSVSGSMTKSMVIVVLSKGVAHTGRLLLSIWEVEVRDS